MPDLPPAPAAAPAPDPDAETPQPPRPAQEIIPAFTPVPRLKDRSNGWNPEVQRAFIEALAETGSVKAACRAVHRTDIGAYALRRHPEGAEFRRAWDAALDIALRRIEDVAMDRALNGVEQPLHYRGEIFGQRRVYNDRLLMFMLRNRASERFGEHRANGVDPLRLAQLKQRWRKEWEAEHRAKSQKSSNEILASINAKLGRMRENWLSDMSPHVRALYRAYQEAERDEQEDRALAAALPLLPGVAWHRYSAPADNADDAEWEDGR